MFAYRNLFFVAKCVKQTMSKHKNRYRTYNMETLVDFVVVDYVYLSSYGFPYNFLLEFKFDGFSLRQSLKLNFAVKIL